MTTKDSWIDKGLVYLVIACTTVMLLSQLLLLKEETRLYLSKVDKMEGVDLASTMPLHADTPLQITEEATVVKNYQKLLRRSKVIVIKPMNHAQHPNVFIIVNGKNIHDLSNGAVQLTVYDGDYVEIDGTSLSQVENFLIEVPDKKIVSPVDGLIVTGTKGILPVGKIKFKNE